MDCNIVFAAAGTGLDHKQLQQELLRSKTARAITLSESGKSAAAHDITCAVQ